MDVHPTTNDLHRPCVCGRGLQPGAHSVASCRKAGRNFPTIEELFVRDDAENSAGQPPNTARAEKQEFLHLMGRRKNNTHDCFYRRARRKNRSQDHTTYDFCCLWLIGNFCVIRGLYQLLCTSCARS